MATTTTSRASTSVPNMYQSRSAPTVNILLATFAGLGLPRTLSVPVATSTPIGDVYASLIRRLPSPDESLIITTVSNKQLLPSDTRPIEDLLSSKDDTLLSLRLSKRLCGGKGGFGSQLRAAGGRMSSRKNRDRQNQNVNGSNRNLDGRRLRTIDEAKKLADYLATKPDMDKREKEERKKRWEAVVEAADRREEEIRSGKAGANKGRLDAEYVESKELAEEKTREAILKSMREGTLQLDRTGSESSMDEHKDSASDEGAESSKSGSSVQSEKQASASGQQFFGWDDEDENEDESEDEDEDVSEDDNEHAGNGDDVDKQDYEGKGKSRAC